MKKLMLFMLLLAVSAFGAESYLKVIDVREVYKTVIVNKPVDRVETVCENNDGTGGSIVGAIIGGVIGSQFGGGNGKLIATGTGAAFGALTGKELSSGSRCYDRRITDYIQDERETFSHYIITVEGGQKFKTQKYFNVGDRAHVQMSLD
jgi:uncharacterized protein YcfJ